MTLVIQTGDRTINAQEIIPLLVNYQMLSRFVCESIIDRAIASIECTSEEIAIASSQLAQQYQLSTDRERQAWLVRHCLSLEQFIALATRNLRIEKFKQANWNNEVRSHFLRRKKQLDRVIYSVILTQDLSIAQEIYFRIQEKEQSFSELARAYSQDSTAEMGGLVGPIELGNLTPSLAKLLSTSQEGQVSFPFRLEKCLAIVRLEKLISAQLDPKMHQRLLDELFKIWLQEKLKQQGYQMSQETNHV